MVNFTSVSGLIAQDQTISIADTGDDGFVTETGITMDSELVTILDPNMDIRSFLVFRDLEINYWEPLKNATLRLHTASTLSFDADSSVTIYGVAQKGFNGFGFSLPVLSAPLTTAHVNVNTSQFYGSQWHEIDITNIIEELIRDPYWDGDGFGGTGETDHIGIIIYGAEGSDTRYFYDYRASNEFEAELIIHWNHDEPPPSGGAVFNETYREYNIWEVDHRGSNRTGSEADVNWNLLDMSELTELDSGAAMTLENDTWVSISAFVAQQHNAFYNDTGSANINSFFVRFKINTTSVTNNGGGGTDRVMAVCSATTVTPVGGNGLLDDPGHGGNWVGLILQVNADDTTYNFRWVDRAGAAFNFGTGSPYYSEAVGQIVYIEVSILDDGAANHWYRWSLYLDEDFETLIFTDTDSIVQGRGPWRYAQVISSLGFGTSVVHKSNFYTYDHMPVAENTTWIVTYLNGTIIVQDLPEYDDAINYIEEMLGDDPQDPDPPGQEWEQTGPFTRFKTRLYIFMMGIVMLWGPVMFFAYRRPSGYNFVVGLFIMLIGLSFLIHAGSV